MQYTRKLYFKMYIDQYLTLSTLGVARFVHKIYSTPYLQSFEALFFSSRVFHANHTQTSKKANMQDISQSNFFNNNFINISMNDIARIQALVASLHHQYNISCHRVRSVCVWCFSQETVASFVYLNTFCTKLLIYSIYRFLKCQIIYFTLS